MSIADKVKEWGDDDHVIWANRGAGPDAYCELCGNGVIALGASRAKTKLNEWHLICRECVNHVRSVKGELRFMGRFKTEAEARRVLK